MNMHDVKVGETYWCNDGIKRKVMSIDMRVNTLGFPYEQVDFLKVSTYPFIADTPGILSKRQFAKLIVSKLEVSA